MAGQVRLSAGRDLNRALSTRTAGIRSTGSVWRWLPWTKNRARAPFKARALLALASALADAQEWERTEQVAHSIYEPEVQAQALVAAATALDATLSSSADQPISSGQRAYLLSARRRIAAAILTKDEWYGILPLVAQFEPGVAVKAQQALALIAASTTP